MNQLKRYGLVEKKSDGDGNCLFHSLALFFAGWSHAMMRAELVNFITCQPDTFAQDIAFEYNCSTGDYCQKMSRLGVEGDAIMLQAFTMCFDVRVWLFMPTGLTTFGSGSKNIALIRRGEHYDAAIPGQS
jgi:hypothetical protein